jgi:CMP-N-acetylneuraminic acid synthetase
MKPELVAILFGRKGSTGFPGKNWLPILGRPALHYPLLAAQHSRFVTRTFVSTDDPRLVELSAPFGAEHIDRPPELCTAEALIEDAIQHAYHEVTRRIGHSPQYVLILMCNACNIVSASVDQGVELLEARADLDSAVTVTRYNMFTPLRARRLAEDGTLQPFVRFEDLGDVEKFNCDRASAGDAYFADGGATVVRGHFLADVKKNLLPFRWMGDRIGSILHEPGGGDIDDPWQVAAMEVWLRRYGFSETATPYDGQARG